MPIRICKCCNDNFQWMPSQKSGDFCKRECQITHKLKEKVLSGNYTKSNGISYFKKVTEYKCIECKNSSWMGKPLKLQIDHIDGDRTNNRIENYRYLCPNCHSQTLTWGVANASEEGVERMKIGGRKGRLAQLEKGKENEAHYRN